MSEAAGRGVLEDGIRCEAPVRGAGPEEIAVEPPALDDGAASARPAKTSSLRHSSRSRPLKLSPKPFCCGLPGAM